jgi:hypothetical protein
MEYANTVQKDAGHSELHAVVAPSEAPSRKSGITSATITIPEDIQIQDIKTPSEASTHSEEDVGVAKGLELLELTDSRNHETTEFDVQETRQTHMPKEVDPNVDNVANSDGYHPMTLDVRVKHLKRQWASVMMTIGRFR